MKGVCLPYYNHWQKCSDISRTFPNQQLADGILYDTSNSRSSYPYYSGAADKPRKTPLEFQIQGRKKQMYSLLSDQGPVQNDYRSTKS